MGNSEKTMDYGKQFSSPNNLKELLLAAFYEPVAYFSLFAKLKSHHKVWFFLLILLVNLAVYLLGERVYEFLVPQMPVSVSVFDDNVPPEGAYLYFLKWAKLLLLVYVPGYLAVYLGLNLTNSANVSLKGIINIFIASQLYYSSYYVFIFLGYFSYWVEFVFLFVITIWGLISLYKVKGSLAGVLLFFGFLPGFCLMEYWDKVKLPGF